MMMAAQLALSQNPWRFQPHPEVWLVVLVVVASYIYAVRVIGARVVGSRPYITPKQLRVFIAGSLLLWAASDWPIHDIAEEYLYSVHMLQHMMLSFFMPPLLLLATPLWLFRAIVGEGRGRRIVRFITKPIVAGVLFNIVVVVTHIPDVVNRSVSNSPLHYSLHVLVVLTALCMWMPIISPDKSYHLSHGGKMIYLFLMSVVPAIPAAWLTFADGAVYKHYDIAVRVWGLSVTTDQQLAGATMKAAGSMFLWSIIIFIFFRRFIKGFFKEQVYTPLKYQDVTDAFGRVPASDPQK